MASEFVFTMLVLWLALDVGKTMALLWGQSPEDGETQELSKAFCSCTLKPESISKHNCQSKSTPLGSCL